MENRLGRPPHGALSESNLQYYPRRESCQRNTNFHSGAHIQDDTLGLSFNQAKSIEPTSLGHQFEKDRFTTQNVSLGSWLNCNGNSNFHVNRTKNVHNTCSHVPREPVEYEGNMQAGTSVVETTWQTQVGPGEAYKSLPLFKSDGAHSRRDPVASSFEEITLKRVTSFEFGQSSNFSNIGRINNLSSVGAAPLGSSLCLEQIQNPISSQNGVQVQGHDLVKIEETKKASDMKNLLCPLSMSSPKNFSPASTVDSVLKKDQAHVSPAWDEKSVSQLGKPASIVAEKLWDGSLQLSPSVLVSAVAFFKSGEKLLDTNWSESVEVKGKVRLEAFEKYIQDLPRSRNRGLMVISLCWKKGSSETGLNGMKEVAKGYKKGGKVGRAPLSPGIDLYICPRSDTIITILAKYGFFKGMSVVEDNTDSMIGCVVWRKTQTYSNFVANKPESKSNSLSEKPLNFPSLSPLQQAEETEKSCLIAQPAQESAKRKVSESKKQIETVAGPDQLKTSLELKKTIMPFSSDKPNKITSSLDVDDLPEFDFKTACGISKTNITAKHSVSVLLDKRLLAEGSRNTDSATVVSHQKNIFDDDDDMPEWCPPERSFAETTNRSTTFPSELKNSPYQTLVLGHPRSVPFCPPFSSQGFPLNAPQSRPFKRGPISSMQSNFDSILGPPPSFEAKVQFYPAEKRRRPNS